MKLVEVAPFGVLNAAERCAKVVFDRGLAI